MRWGARSGTTSTSPERHPLDRCNTGSRPTFRVPTWRIRRYDVRSVDDGACVLRRLRSVARTRTAGGAIIRGHELPTPVGNDPYAAQRMEEDASPSASTPGAIVDVFENEGPRRRGGRGPRSPGRRGTTPTPGRRGTAPTPRSSPGGTAAATIDPSASTTSTTTSTSTGARPSWDPWPVAPSPPLPPTGRPTTRTGCRSSPSPPRTAGRTAGRTRPRTAPPPGTPAPPRPPRGASDHMERLGTFSFAAAGAGDPGARPAGGPAAGRGGGLPLLHRLLRRRQVARRPHPRGQGPDQPPAAGWTGAIPSMPTSPTDETYRAAKAASAEARTLATDGALHPKGKG